MSHAQCPRFLPAILVEGKVLFPAKNEKLLTLPFITAPLLLPLTPRFTHTHTHIERERERDEGLLQDHNGSNTGNGGEPCHCFGPSSGAAS